MWLDHLLFRETYPVLDVELCREDSIQAAESCIEHPEFGHPKVGRGLMLASKLLGWVHGLLAQVVRAHP